MTDDEAAEVAHLIVEFRDELRRALGPDECHVTGTSQREPVFSLLARRVRWQHV